MGNLHSTGPTVYQTQSDLSLAEKSLLYVRTKKDARLGEIDELQHAESGRKIFRRDVVIEDPSIHNDSHLTNLENRVNLRHTNLLQTYGFYIASENLVSKQAVRISFYLEPFATDASAEFRSRAKQQNYFQDEELLGSLLYCLHVLDFLQSHGINHGNVTPISIVMATDGEIKLFDYSLLYKDHSLYRLASKGLHVPYVAPELMPLLKANQEPSDGRYNAYKADAFSLGMTFLYAALLEEPTDCYDWNNLSFNHAKLFDRYEEVRKRFKGPFANVLQYLLKIDPKERPDFANIVQNLDYFKTNDFYIRDPRFVDRNQQSTYPPVVNSSDFVTRHLASPKSTFEKVHDFLTPKKSEYTPSSTFIPSSTHVSSFTHVPSSIHAQAPVHFPTSTHIPASTSHYSKDKISEPYKSLAEPFSSHADTRPPATNVAQPVYNFVDPKVQAIIREAREKSAPKQQSYSGTNGHQTPYRDNIVNSLAATQPIVTPHTAASTNLSSFTPAQTSSSPYSQYVPSQDPKLSTYNMPYSSPSFNAVPQDQTGFAYSSPSTSNAGAFQPRFNNPFMGSQFTQDYIPHIQNIVSSNAPSYVPQNYHSADKEKPLTARDFGSSNPLPTTLERPISKFTQSAPRNDDYDNKLEKNKQTFNSAKVNDIIFQIRSRNASPAVKSNIPYDTHTAEKVNFDKPSFLASPTTAYQLHETLLDGPSPVIANKDISPLGYDLSKKLFEEEKEAKSDVPTANWREIANTLKEPSVFEEAATQSNYQPVVKKDKDLVTEDILRELREKYGKSARKPSQSALPKESAPQEQRNIAEVVTPQVETKTQTLASQQTPVEVVTPKYSVSEA